MIRITLEFPSVDQAIVALGKLVGAPLKVASDAGSQASAAQAPGAPTIHARKGRADKGKPRGSRTEPTVAATTAPEQGVSVPAVVTAIGVRHSTAAAPPTVGLTVVPSAAIPSAADAQQGLEKLFEQKGIAAAQDLLARYGVKRLRDLKENQRAEFVAETVQLLGAA